LLATRIVTALVLGSTVTVAVLFLPTIAAAPLLGILWLLGSWEWAGLALWPQTARVAYAVLFALLMLGSLSVSPPPGASNILLAVTVLVWLIAFYAILTFPRPTGAAMVSISGLLLVLPSWVLLTYIHASAPLGPELSLTVLALVWAADVGAFVMGHWIGRHKLAPQISPGKTWEGVGGGVLLAVLVAVLIRALFGFALQWLMPLAIVVALVSVVGDLTVSMLKRNAGVKDSSQLLPGHGGVMDRIDGLIAAIPFFALGLKVAGVLD